MLSFRLSYIVRYVNSIRILFVVVYEYQTVTINDVLVVNYTTVRHKFVPNKVASV